MASPSISVSRPTPSAPSPRWRGGELPEFTGLAAGRLTVLLPDLAIGEAPAAAEAATEARPTDETVTALADRVAQAAPAPVTAISVRLHLDRFELTAQGRTLRNLEPVELALEGSSLAIESVYLGDDAVRRPGDLFVAGTVGLGARCRST